MANYPGYAIPQFGLGLALHKGQFASSTGTGTPPAAPTLTALTLSPSTAIIGTAYSGTVTGKTAGSVLSLSGAGAAGLSVTGTAVTGTPTTAGAVNIIETLAGATNTPNTSSGVLTVAAAAPAAVILPTPSFGATNLVAWWDATKTYTDSSGASQPSINYDTIGHNSVASWYDISGNGYDWTQNDKSLQPSKGANGGVYIDQTAYYMDCLRKSMFNGLTQVSIYALVVPQAGTGARALLYASEGNTSAPVLSVSIVAGGAGYATGDQIVLTGGTASSQATLEVLAQTAGVITSIGIINGGAYTVAPTNPVSQGSVTSITGGASSGTTATFNVVVGDIGNGSSVERLGLYYSSGSTGRKPFITNSVQDTSQATTVATSYQSIGPANGGALTDMTTKRRVGHEIDMTGATYQPYYGGAADSTPQTIATGRLGNNDSVMMRLGNNATPNRPLAMEIIAMLVLAEIPNSTRRTQIDTYLAGL